MPILAISLDTSGFARALGRYVAGTGADADKAARMAARIYMRNVIAITPPGDGAQAGDRAALTKSDQRRGEISLRVDLGVLFIGVRLKGKRPEQFPDVAGIHRAALVNFKHPGKRLPKSLGPARYVDETKLRALVRTLLPHIGRMAAEWVPAADLVKTPGIPAWVRRHASRGGAGEITPEGAPKFRFMAANASIPTKILAELDRRMVYACQYTENNLNRQLRAILARRAGEFKQAA